MMNGTTVVFFLILEALNLLYFFTFAEFGTIKNVQLEPMAE